jgi:hypothetical protein
MPYLLNNETCVDVTVVKTYEKMKHEKIFLDEAMKQKNNRYAERRNAAGFTFMTYAFAETGAICKKMTPLIHRIARYTAKVLFIN